MAVKRGVVSISNESVVTWERLSEFSVLFSTEDIDILSSLTLPFASTSILLDFCESTMSPPPPLSEFQIPFEDSLSVTFFSLAAALSLASFVFLPRTGNALSFGFELRTTPPRCMGWAVGSDSPSSVIDVSPSGGSVGTACPACIGMSSEKKQNDTVINQSVDSVYRKI